MARLRLKNLIGNRNKAASVISNLIQALDESIYIQDAEGRSLLGKTDEKNKERYPVTFEEEVMGWAGGGEKAETVAGLLSHLISKEAEKKMLGNEVLGIYRELNLIYNFSEKLAASLEITSVGAMALEQAGQLINASAGSVLIIDEETQVLEPVASFGEKHAPGERKLGEGIIGVIAANGVAEIVNDVSSDPRQGENEKAINSLICAPLKVKERTKGVIALVNETPVSYLAGELKLLTTVASQAVLAIENALLHEKLVQEATRTIEARRRELEIAVRERTAELEKQKENVELLSEIGRDITASLSIKNVIDTVYEHVNALMDAVVFGIGIYNEKEERIYFPATKEKGKTLPKFYNSVNDTNRPAIWCFNHQKEMVINDYDAEYSKYFDELQVPVEGEYALSVLYLPLTYHDKKMGVITAQSFNKNAYTEYHLNILRNLATYTAIALDNAEAYRELDVTLQNLKQTQQQLFTQEKLASLGQLTAGIAHEIKNPLNFVNNFAELSAELVVELREDLEKQKDRLEESDLENIEAILTDLEQNAKKINEHGKRADSIVKSMLQHSRGSASERQPTDLNSMLEEDLNLAYHGMRAQDSSFNVKIETEFDESLGELNVVPQDISRVFLNIITNGFYAAHKKMHAGGDNGFSPTLSVRTRRTKDGVQIRIKDNGNGVPSELREKLFEPFFTTKPTGQGTGLGLSISYDIVVQEHKGDLTFETKDGEFTEFIISLPT